MIWHDNAWKRHLELAQRCSSYLTESRLEIRIYHTGGTTLVLLDQTTGEERYIVVTKETLNRLFNSSDPIADLVRGLFKQGIRPQEERL